MVGLRRVLAPNPAPLTGPGTNSYLVGSEPVVVVDPGPADPAHLDRLVEAGAGQVAYVVVTHGHADHAAGAGPLAERTGATLLACAPDALEAGAARTGSLHDGDEIAVPGARLRVIATPGHAPDHCCLLVEASPTVPSRPARALLSGDLVLGGTSVAVAAPDGDMAAYLASLERLLALEAPAALIAPGHGPVITDPPAALTALLAHRRAREAAVLDALGLLGPASAAVLLGPVYGALDPALAAAARATLWAHLRKLGSEGRATCADRDDPGALWSPAPLSAPSG